MPLMHDPILFKIYDFLNDLLHSEKVTFLPPQKISTLIDFVCVFVRLFVCGLSSHSRIFHSFGDVTITDERLQILTNARQLWPLSSECSLACHTYYDTGHPFMMVISDNP